MAGGKETVRQKMIGMMYLVLTALLALQVSSAIILKFQYLDESLMTVNNKTVGDNTNTVKGIQQAVAKAGSRPKDVLVIKDADAVRSKTAELISYMNGLRDLLVTNAGGPGEEGAKYKAPNEEEAVARTMIGGPNKNGKAYELEKRLNEYAAFLRQYNPNVPAKLAVGGSEDPTAKRDPDQRSKDFAHLNFESTPLVAGLAVLAQKESEILKYESDILTSLAGKVGADQIKFDKIFGTATAESNTVAAGTKYRAEMFLTAFSSNLSPKMSSTAGPVRVQNGRGVVEFTAAGGGPKNKDGLIEKSWKGTITLTNNGQDTSISFTQKYFVVEPEMQIQSASVNALYFKCGNRLNVQVPALGALYDPIFSGSGAGFAKGAKKGEVLINPTANKVTLNVTSGGAKIGSQTFDVRKPPKPDVIVLVNGRPVDPLRGMPASSPRQISINVVPDEDFASKFKEDARYQATEATVILGRGTDKLAEMPIRGGSANISSLMSRARPGDKLVVQVREVVRLNYKNDIEEIPGAAKPTVITLN
ncbi:gliding motility protein GldM [Adhaeribacter aquaticus]|uniref:type IX secretion system motor protein PorM/GldM n=1 Tax=Adhaeribacter aquaticus TaxID=299567 RepID=UPI00047C4E8E|nr:gliding motility protein GldM [Adhaeribacter aquaticus]